MGILGASPEDLWRCLLGGPWDDEEACERVYFGYVLFPRLQHELERLKLMVVPGLPHPPGPDPGPLVEQLVPVLLARQFAEPNPQPSAKLRLQATTTFRDGLQNVVSQLDKEITQLKKQSSGQKAA